MSPAPPAGASAQSWEQRGRAESFGAVAEEYDAVRPRYPAAVVEAVLAGFPASAPAGPGPVRVLDVGTGTGILARALTAAGADVVGADIDEGMAAVARRSGLTVHVGPFEQLELDQRFDRITVAQAWHWIDPEAGVAAARRLLAPGGQLWLIWNIELLTPAIQAVTDAVYARFAEETVGVVTRGVSRRGSDAAEAVLAGLPDVTVETIAVPWRAELPTATWLRLVGTFSDHNQLPPAVRERLFTALGEAVDAAGGVVTLERTTRVVVATGLGS